jgi:hypothetical protein
MFTRELIEKKFAFYRVWAISTIIDPMTCEWVLFGVLVGILG